MKESSKQSALLQQEESVRSFYRRLIDKSDSYDDSDSNWLVTLSDLLFMLLIFLAMLFVMTNSPKSIESAQVDNVKNLALPVDMLQQEAAAVGEKIKDELTLEIETLDLGDEISVLATSKEIIITMGEKVTFRPGEAEILEGSEPVLENIADIIRRYPFFQVEIDGHTDNVPIQTRLYPSNWELSVARATSVLKYFMNTQDIDPSRLTIRGNADQKPVVPNDTPENRAQNRRVEIRLKDIEF